MAGFETQRFVEDCKEACAQEPTHKGVREVLARAVAEPAAILEGLGAPERAGVEILYRSESLTVLNVVWGPMMTVPPHNHEMWAAIGIYTGREDNIFWCRSPDGRLDAAGVEALGVKDAMPLGRDVIHSVNNPIAKLTGAIHVYGGDFFSARRREWDAETFVERPYDFARNMKLFEVSNRLLELV